MGVTTALEWLSSCSGCEIAILNIGEDLVELLTEHLDIVHAPVIMDHKYYGQCGDEGEHLQIPEAVVGIVTGGVANEEVTESLRRRIDATHGSQHGKSSRRKTKVRRSGASRRSG